MWLVSIATQYACANSKFSVKFLCFSFLCPRRSSQIKFRKETGRRRTENYVKIHLQRYGFIPEMIFIFFLYFYLHSIKCVYVLKLRSFGKIKIWNKREKEITKRKRAKRICVHVSAKKKAGAATTTIKRSCIVKRGSYRMAFNEELADAGTFHFTLSIACRFQFELQQKLFFPGWLSFGCEQFAYKSVIA